MEGSNQAKELIIASINSIPDEQANEISYYFAQELYNNKITINEFADKITTVSFDNVFYSIYRGAYHEDYNKEKTLTDYQSKTKTGSYDDEN